MARTLYLENGNTEYLIPGEDKREKLRDLIREQLGRDCEELYDEIFAEVESQTTDETEYERIADGLHSLAFDAMSMLREALKQPKLSRKKVQAVYDELYRNLCQTKT